MGEKEKVPKKETYYFSHDYTSRSDQKIKNLLVKHGFKGYGIFWAIVEDLYMNANAMRTHYDSIAYDLRTDEETVYSIINDFDLFQISNGYFSSNSIKKRLLEREEKSSKARNSANARWHANASEKDANALRPESDRNPIKERKVKESKEVSNPIGLLGILDSTEAVMDLKKKYADLEKKLVDEGADAISAFTCLKEFINEHRPIFPEPYIAVWNIFASKYEFSRVEKINEVRRTKIRARVQDKHFDFIKILDKIRTSKQVTQPGNWPWKVNFDHIIENDSNYVKIIEGQWQ